MTTFAEHRERWFGLVERLKPVLRQQRSSPGRPIMARRDGGAWLGWSESPVGNRPVPGQVLLDFGVHHVGYVRVKPASATAAAVTLRFGEVLAEVCEEARAFPGTLGGEWLAPVAATADADGWLTHGERRAFRYVLVSGVGVAESHAISESSVDEDGGTSASLAPEWQAIDEVAIRTLRNCMQGVFEDGPKRDRRLWLGDLRLQAMANYVSFANYDLVKRCLYLFAACAYEDGIVPACVYELPKWHGGTEFIPDYSLLYGPTLLEYALASDDWETAQELWPVALRQLDLIERYADSRGLFTDPKTAWLFIDWCPELDRQAAIVGTMLYSLGRMAILAGRLGLHTDAAELREKHSRLRAAARTHLLDSKTGLFVSGPSRQVSWASQVWMILGSAVSRAEAQAILARLGETEEAIAPITPYLNHHVVEAYLWCGMREQAEALLSSYWGEMIRLGATTFWEVFDPHQHTLSPYGSHLHNSYCHAWSCTPSYLLRSALMPVSSGCSTLSLASVEVL